MHFVVEIEETGEKWWWMVHSDDADMWHTIILSRLAAVIGSVVLFIIHIVPHVLYPVLYFLSKSMYGFCETPGWAHVWHEWHHVHLSETHIIHRVRHL